jgi:hypothetical protein
MALIYEPGYTWRVWYEAAKHLADPARLPLFIGKARLEIQDREIELARSGADNLEEQLEELREARHDLWLLENSKQQTHPTHQKPHPAPCL